LDHSLAVFAGGFKNPVEVFITIGRMSYDVLASVFCPLQLDLVARMVVLIEMTLPLYI
jgi:hypothetical protein